MIIIMIFITVRSVIIIIIVVHLNMFQSTLLDSGMRCWGLSAQVSTIYHPCGYCVEGDVLDVTGLEVLRLFLGVPCRKLRGQSVSGKG